MRAPLLDGTEPRESLQSKWERDYQAVMDKINGKAAAKGEPMPFPPKPPPVLVACGWCQKERERAALMDNTLPLCSVCLPKVRSQMGLKAYRRIQLV